MLEKKTGRGSTPTTVLTDGLYIRRRGSLILVTESLNFRKQPLIKLSAPPGIFRVIDGMIIPLSGVAGVTVGYNPRATPRSVLF